MCKITINTYLNTNVKWYISRKFYYTRIPSNMKYPPPLARGWGIRGQ